MLTPQKVAPTNLLKLQNIYAPKIHPTKNVDLPKNLNRKDNEIKFLTSEYLHPKNLRAQKF